MLFKLAKFEFNYFRKQPSFYVTSLIFFLLPFFAMISDNVQIGGSSNVNFNSPHAITQTMLIMSILGMFLVANFVGGTAVRDVTNKMDGIMLSMPIDKPSYLWGRLAGALAFCLVVFAASPLGTLIGSFWYSVDPERLGDTSLIPYLWSYLVFVIPNFLFCSVLFYIFAIKTRSMMGMYLGVIAFFILYNVSRQLMSDPSLTQLSAMLDPFAIGAFSDAVNYWTPFERNTQLVPLEGDLLLNRILWLAVTAVMLVVSHVVIDIRKPAKVKKDKSKADKKPMPTSFNLAKPSVAGNTHWTRFWSRTNFEVKQIIKSPPFVILCLFSMFTLITLFFDTNGMFGTSNWPLTRNMAGFIQGAFSLMALIVVTYYSAEIVWKERELGIGDIVESTPIKNWTIYFPKLVALTSVILAITLSGIAFTVFFQVIKGYTNFEWGVYFGYLALQFVVPMVMSTILAVFIQVLSPNKYVGMLIFVLYIISTLVLAQLGLEHNMWHFGERPGVVYSDINGYGHFLESAFWYNVYWIGFTVMLVVLGYGLWRRGSEFSLKYRFKMLKPNMGGFGTVSLLAGLMTFVASGSYIYYNTRVLNDFVSRDERIDWQVDFEKKYRQFEKAPVPSITDVYANVDFYPSERKVVAKGYYLFTNNNDQPLEKVMLNWSGGKNRQLAVTIENGKEVERDDEFNISWIEFSPALQPGDSSRLDFEYTRANKGFVDQASDTRVVGNGSFVNNGEIFPHFGYDRSRQLGDRHERRKNDLPPPERVAKLEDQSQYGTNFIGPEADFINFETIVSTSEEQFAISPGYLQKEWVKDGRRYFHYKMDAPIFNFVAFLSGTYAVDKDIHNDVSIEVYHHPNHEKNVQRMIDATKASLDYYGKEFSPYQHRQVRIIEFPRYARFAQSFSNTIPYSEDIGFVADLRDEEAIDYVYFVTAHEMAHQWWGHQVTPADVQGGAVLSETLSEYSAYMVMEKMLGKHQLRKFLKWEMDRYLRGRSGEILEEMPLYRAENQQYIHYQKGGVVMYALRDRFGEQAINAALRKFLNKFQYASNPYPTTLDLIEFIKAEVPVSGHVFVDDMFKKITIFDLELKSAVAEKLENGNYKLTLDINAKKFYADGQGQETEVALDDVFDVGVFAEDPDSAKTTAEDVLHLEKHTIKQGENQVTLEVSKLPKFAGIDPYIKMIDRNSDDNLKAVEIK